MVCHMENIFIFIWTFQILRQPQKTADLGYFQKMLISLTYLFSYGLFKFYANPKNQLILAIFKNCQFHLKWPKTLLENGFKTYFLVCDRENPFIWTFQILRQPPPNLNNLFLFKRIGCNICEWRLKSANFENSPNQLIFWD